MVSRRPDARVRLTIPYKIPGNSARVLEIGSWSILFSYDIPVAARCAGVGFFRTSERYSRTTSRHLNIWLGQANTVKLVDPEWFDDLLTEGTKATMVELNSPVHGGEEVTL